LPISDSALVIDLPDGQKLVVGKMSHGTVIEVATWRGTGRPDSRTNRMMLGMSNTEIEAQIHEEEERQATQSAAGWRARLQKASSILLALFRKSSAIAIKVFSKLSDIKPNSNSAKKSSISKALPFLSKVDSSTEYDDEVQSWLDKVTAKSIKKMDAVAPAAKSTTKSKKGSNSKSKSAKK